MCFKSSSSTSSSSSNDFISFQRSPTKQNHCLEQNGNHKPYEVGENMVEEMRLLYSSKTFSCTQSKPNQDSAFSAQTSVESINSGQVSSSSKDAKRNVSRRSAKDSSKQLVPTLEAKSSPKPTKEKASIQSEHNPSNEYQLCGLENPALICYSNACLQVLYTALSIRNGIFMHAHAGPFHRKIAALFHQMQTNSSSRSVVQPYHFNDQFRAAKPQFSEHYMHDAQEYLTILIELMHQEVNRAKKIKTDVDGKMPPVAEFKDARQAWQWHLAHVDNSYLSDCLMGQLETALRCITCGQQSLSWAAFWQLQLHLSDQNPSKDHPHKVLSLSNDCLAEFIAEETLDGDSAPICSKCKSAQPTSKKHTICRTPARYLIVHLKRFNCWGRKIFRPVSIDERLHLCEQWYVLHCAVLHIGNENLGHYATVLREDKNKWTVLDDEKVQPVRISDDQMANTGLKNNAYLCIYKAVTANEQYRAPQSA